MLFDLSGKRKRVVQVVYAALAILFAVSFVGFGIGSDAAGGLFDAIGVGGDDSTSDDPAFEADIDDAEARLATDPKDEQALQDLISVRFQAGNAALDSDETTGQVSLTPEAETQYREAIASWKTYLKVADKPNSGSAAIANNAYGTLLQFSDPQDVPGLAEDAIPSAQITAEDVGGVGPWFTLAQYAYFGGDPDLGDEAAAQAIKEVDPSQKKQIQKDLEATAKAAAELKKQIEKQAEKGTGDEAFTNPLEQGGAAGGLGGTPVPGAPVTPTP